MISILEHQQWKRQSLYNDTIVDSFPRHLLYLLTWLLYLLFLSPLYWRLKSFIDSLACRERRKLIETNLGFSLYPPAIGFVTFGWVCVCWTGRTIGMAIIGLKVVETKTGASVFLWRSALRTCLLPLNFICFLLVGWIGAFRRDGRMLPDLIAGTGMIWK